MTALTQIQEDILIAAHNQFGHELFELGQCFMRPYRPFQIRDTLNELVELDLVESPVKGAWELNDRGVTLGLFLDAVNDKKLANKRKREQDAIDNPRPDRKLALRDQWEIGHHYAIPALIAHLNSPKCHYEIEDESDEFFAAALYTDGVKWVMKLGVSLADLKAGKYDTRFSHVLVVYPFAEDK